MAEVKLKGSPIHTNGKLPLKGEKAPEIRGVDVDLHVGLLHAENKVIVTNVRSKVTDNLIVSRPNRLSVGLPVLAKSAPVDAVNVNKTFVVDGQLEVIRHELTGLARSGRRDHNRL